jgi:outer membrane protein TolC
MNHSREDSMKRSAMRPLLVASAFCGLFVSACTMLPEPLTPEENGARAAADRHTIEGQYVPLGGPLSLSGAIARALKYNYDDQLAKAEVSLQDKQLDLAMAQMLPRLAAGAGRDLRDRPYAAESIDVITNEQSLAWSFSEEPDHSTADMTLSWNALDLGVSYFQAKQQGYRTLIAVERRRRVIDTIVKNTATAYWRAAAAAQLLPKIDPLLSEARRILSISRQVGTEHLQSPLALLDFQQSMIIVLGELQNIRNDLAAANIELATLINVPPTTRLTFTTRPHDLPPPSSIDNHKLEDISLLLRPELRVEAYQQKIDRQDTYKEIIKMMPGVGMVGGFNYDSNNLLYRNVWSQLGLRASFNLFNLIQGPLAINVAKESVELDEQRRLALSVAVLSQVNLSVQEYANALASLRIAAEVDAVGQQIATVANDATTAGIQSEFDRIRRQMTVLTARIARDKALARANTALAGIYSSVGADLVPVGAELDDLQTLTSQVEQAVRGWQDGRLPQLSASLAKTASNSN